MSINRNNYEEFFMMYADGELSLADRQTVDRFVMENPDLAEELALYHQLQLPDENISFADKNSLYRIAAEDVDAANHEEKFLLYVDDELDSASREKVERFVLQNPSYQESFTLLKQTKLPVETLVFAHKGSLYRKEEKKRPVLYMRWVQMAAAAVFIGLAVLVWTLLPHNDNAIGTKNLASVKTGTGISAGNQDKQQPAETRQPESSTVMPENRPDVLASVATAATNSNDTKTGTTIISPVVKTGSDAAEKQPDLIALANVTPVEEKPQAVNNGNAADQHTSTAKPGIPVTGDSPDVIAKTVKHDDEEMVPVHNAVYKELDTDDEKKSLYLGSLEINKDKLRGFFRKAGSLFRSKARQQEEENNDDATPASRRTLK